MIERKWTKERAVDLAMRLRWEIANGKIKNKDVINAGKLGERLTNFSNCASNLSRWLRQTEDANRWKLLTDRELDALQTWLTAKTVSAQDVLCRALLGGPQFAMNRWLRSGSPKTINFQKEYRIYRSSAIAAGKVVIGRLLIDQGPEKATTTERYELTGTSDKDGSYIADGFLLPGVGEEVYMLSKFENADLQMIIFSNVQRTGRGANEVRYMSGALINTMERAPYVTRVYCDGNVEVRLGTVDIADLPERARAAMDPAPKLAAHNVVRF